jgi:putative intracellular protease/amidase
MRILSLVHGPLVRSEFFGDVAQADGHELVEWSVVDEQTVPPAACDYDAVFILGGHMNVDD